MKLSYDDNEIVITKQKDTSKKNDKYNNIVLKENIHKYLLEKRKELDNLVNSLKSPNTAEQKK